MKKIVVDTNVIIYFLANDEKFGEKARTLFQRVENGELQAMASVITYSEVMTLPLKKKDHLLVKKYRELFQVFPNFEFISLDLTLAEKAAELRSAHAQLKLMDAYILATAWQNEASLVTEDKILHRLSSPVKVVSLQEMI